MLPSSAQVPGLPGSGLSPFGVPSWVNVGPYSPWGYILRRGKWMVRCGANSVQMFTMVWPESIPYRNPPPPLRFRPAQSWAARGGPHSAGLSPLAWPASPPPGPPAPTGPCWMTLVPYGATGVVAADGQNVRICGSGGAFIMEVY